MLNIPAGTLWFTFYLHFTVLFYYLILSSFYIHSVFTVFWLCCFMRHNLMMMMMMMMMIGCLIGQLMQTLCFLLSAIAKCFYFIATPCIRVTIEKPVHRKMNRTAPTASIQSVPPVSLPRLRREKRTLFADVVLAPSTVTSTWVASALSRRREHWAVNVCLKTISFLNAGKVTLLSQISTLFVAEVGWVLASKVCLSFGQWPHLSSRRHVSFESRTIMFDL